MSSMNHTPAAPPPMQPAPGYEFLNNEPQKKSIVPGGGSKKGRVIVVVAGAFLLLFIGIVVAAILGNAGNGTKNDLIRAVQQQAELVRISEIGTKDATGPEARNLAVTTNLSLASSQESLRALATKAGAKLDKQAINAGLNEQTDKDLEQAKQINRFDEVFTELLQTQLLAYQQTLKRIHDAAQNESSKTTLAELYNNATALVNQDWTTR